MNDGTSAGQVSIPQASSEDLAAVFTEHSDRLTRWVYNRLDRADWHLAEDITSEAFVRLVRDFTGRRIENPAGLLRTIAGHAITDHYRLRRSGEQPTDFGDWFEAARLPAATSAEDIAVTHLTVLAMVADPAAPLEVAA
ncbi:RNA polymerase sigma factor [Streptomyces sp. NPDC004778]